MHDYYKLYYILIDNSCTCSILIFKSQNNILNARVSRWIPAKKERKITTSSGNFLELKIKIKTKFI